MRPCQQGRELAYHQADFKEIRGDAHEHVDFTEHVKVERGHAIIISDAGKEVHQDELTVTLATIAGFLVCRFAFRSTLDNYQRRGAATRTGCKNGICKVTSKEGLTTYCNDLHKPLRGSPSWRQIQRQGNSWVRGYRTVDRPPRG